MSTPIFNSIGTTLINTSGLDGNVASLIDGRKWGGAVGTGVNLTFSFPSGDEAFFIDPYGEDEPSGWNQLTTPERNAVRAALDEWSDVANINFSPTSDTSLVVGDLRFAVTNRVDADSNAHAYTPGNFPEAGDVWFNVDSWHTSSGTAIVPGTYDYFTIVHEIGHAIGLKHPFEFPDKIDAQFDSYSFSIMSYAATTGDPDSNDATFYPTTPMWYDLLAIQTLYGERPHNAGNTTYTYVSGGNYWETIDDSAGIDTIRHIGSDAATIDLRIGFWSNLGRSIFFTNAPNQSDTVMIGPRSNIENAIGGNGNDTLNGNNLANKLTGNAGNDALRGFGGNDVMNGGAGKDTLTGGPGFDSFVFNTALTAFDTISGYSVAQDVIKLAKKVFDEIGATLTANEFRLGSVATTDFHHILYLKGTGQLFFDNDGRGGDPAVQFAKLSPGLAMNASEFLMI